MATISSIGIGSGLDANSIITKLVDLEKQPLTMLKSKAGALGAQLSAYGTIKGQVSSLSDSAISLGTAALWNPLTVTTSLAAAVSATANGVPTKASYSMEVQQLARAQSTASASVASGTVIGTGTLSIQLGAWDTGMTAFTPGAASALTVTIAAGETSLASIASKINDANAGVSATVVTDANGQRLSLKSTTSGAAAGFRIQVTDDDGTNTDNTGLSQLGFDPAAGAFGMGTTSTTTLMARDAQATLNGVPVSSGTNTFTGLVPGLTFQVGQVTTAPVEIAIAQDTAAIKKTITNFVDSFNKLNSTLTELTKYDAANKTGSLLQGDSVTVGLQNALRSLIGSSTPGGTYTRLSDIGVTLQRDGSLAIDSKLDASLQNLDQLKSFFTTTSSIASTAGFGVKLKSFTLGLLGSAGTLSSKSTSIQKGIDTNTAAQQKVTDRANSAETRLRAQYSALDGKMASLTALGNYVSQQVTLWNKNTS
jgi:flagellar hook-associated protein 2